MAAPAATSSGRTWKDRTPTIDALDRLLDRAVATLGARQAEVVQANVLQWLRGPSQVFDIAFLRSYGLKIAMRIYPVRRTSWYLTFPACLLR